MKTTWKITTFENGRPAAHYDGIPHGEAMRLIARAQDASFDVERELNADEGRQRELRAA